MAENLTPPTVEVGGEGEYVGKAPESMYLSIVHTSFGHIL